MWRSEKKQNVPLPLRVCKNNFDRWTGSNLLLYMMSFLKNRVFLIILTSDPPEVYCRPYKFQWKLISPLHETLAFRITLKLIIQNTKYGIYKFM